MFVYSLVAFVNEFLLSYIALNYILVHLWLDLLLDFAYKNKKYTYKVASEYGVSNIIIFKPNYHVNSACP